jgi:hypothetical protein
MASGWNKPESQTMDETVERLRKPEDGAVGAGALICVGTSVLHRAEAKAFVEWDVVWLCREEGRNPR